MAGLVDRRAGRAGARCRRLPLSAASLTLDAVPPRLLVHVSATSATCSTSTAAASAPGPGRGDPEHWRFETYDHRAVAAARRQPRRRHRVELRPGGADGADDAPHRFPSPGRRPGVCRAQYRQGLGGADRDRPRRDARRAHGAPARGFYYAAGPGERRDGRQWDWAWDAPDSPAARWVAGARNLARPSAVDQRRPGLDAVARRLAARAERAAAADARADRGRQHRAKHRRRRFRPGARRQASRLLRAPTCGCCSTAGTLTNAYPTVVVSGGRDARLRRDVRRSAVRRGPAQGQPRDSRRQGHPRRDRRIRRRWRHRPPARAALVPHVAVPRTRT